MDITIPFYKKEHYDPGAGPVPDHKLKTKLALFRWVRIRKLFLTSGSMSRGWGCLQHGTMENVHIMNDPNC